MSENHIEHPTPKRYVQIAIVLGILTAIEIALYYTEDIVGVFTDPISVSYTHLTLPTSFLV